MSETQPGSSGVTAVTEDRSILMVLGALGVAIVFAFWSPIENFWFRWTTQVDELGHSFIVPGVTAWMLWERKNAVIGSLGKPDPIGFWLAGFSLVLLFMGEMVYAPLFGQSGLILLVMASIILLGGRSLFWICLIPLAYLFFIVPPPHTVISSLTAGFQVWSSDLGAFFIRMFGIPVHVRGVVIDLGTTDLLVAEACAGLRYLFPFICFGALAAYFYKGPWWHRAIILLSVFPITVLLNSVRIAIMGVLLELYGIDTTVGTVHDMLGLVVFLLCMALLLCVIWGFTLMRGKTSPFAFVGFEELDAVPPKGPWNKQSFVRHGSILTVAVLVVGVLCHTVGNRAPVIPERLDLATLPYEFEGWRTREVTLQANVAQTLNADDYIISEMLNPEGEQFNLYIAYINARRNGKSWHSPQQCLPGGGWEITLHEVVPTQRADGREYFHNRIVARDEADNEYLIYYWYDQRGRKLADEYTMRFLVMWDDFTSRRSDGAMVRLLTRVEPTETMDDAERRLDATRRQLEPILTQYVPE